MLTIPNKQLKTNQHKIYDLDEMLISNKSLKRI